MLGLKGKLQSNQGDYGTQNTFYLQWATEVGLIVGAGGILEPQKVLPRNGSANRLAIKRSTSFQDSATDSGVETVTFNLAHRVIHKTYMLTVSTTGTSSILKVESRQHRQEPMAGSAVNSPSPKAQAFRHSFTQIFTYTVWKCLWPTGDSSRHQQPTCLGRNPSYASKCKIKSWAAKMILCRG